MEFTTRSYPQFWEGGAIQFITKSQIKLLRPVNIKTGEIITFQIMKKRKLEELLVQVLRHDYDFYNRKFRWQGLPSPLNTSFDTLLPSLNNLEQQGIIKLFSIERRTDD